MGSLLEARLGKWQAESGEAAKLLEELYSELTSLRQLSASLESTKLGCGNEQLGPVADAATEAREAAAEVRQKMEETQAALAEVQSSVARVSDMERAVTSAIDVQRERLEMIARSAEASALEEARRLALDAKTRAFVDNTTGRRFDADLDDLRRIVDQAARRYFEADRVGEFDYALAAAGGVVVPSLTSEPYTPTGRIVPTRVWHAIGRDAGVGRPEDAIDNKLNFGSCFAFAGKAGNLTVKTAAERLRPTSFSLEHIHGALCNPVHNANCSSAPRNFRVFGRPQLHDAPTLLGRFTYEANSDLKPAVQNFPVDRSLYEPEHQTAHPFNYITLDVQDNHGHPNYTCIYRFRVHGRPGHI